MTVTEAVKLSGLTPSADYTGVETTDDFLLAVQTEASQTDVKNWVVCADHVREHSGALNATTTDNTYIRTGPVTTKGSTPRTLSIQGDRYVATPFRTFCSPTGSRSAPARASWCPTSTSPFVPARAKRARARSS